MRSAVVLASGIPLPHKPPVNAVGGVYGRCGAGYSPVGLAADQRGRVLLLQMCKWATYAVGVFSPDGKPEDPGRLR